MYSHPAIVKQHPALGKIQPGDIVGHQYKPGTPLVVVSGPHDGLFGRRKYIVELPTGERVPVLEKNLIR